MELNKPNRTTCLVLIPAGPGLRHDHVQDTLDSVAHYMAEEETAVCLLDDTKDCEFRYCTAGALRLWYVPSLQLHCYEPGESVWGALWLKQIRVLAQMRAVFDYSIVLRLDTDALITGPSPHRDIARSITPGVGLVGAFTRRGDGSLKTQRPAGDALRAEMDDPDPRLIVRNDQLRRLYDEAVKNGYRLGMNCTGGSFFLMRSAVDRIVEMGLEKYNGLTFSEVGEDHLFGLATYAVGYSLADAPQNLMAVNWQGPPMAPEEAVRRGIKVFHPVKLSGDPTMEDRIRISFRAMRVPREPV